MTDTFDSQVANIGLQPVQYYVDDDGSLKFISQYIASSNFNGSIPIIDDGDFLVTDLKPGMYFSLSGSGTGTEYLPIISVEQDDAILEADELTNKVIVRYLNTDSLVTSVTYDDTATVAVRYEDWDNKDLGILGWGITSGGNAIFSNVAVRGRIEATEGEISGTLAIVEGGSIYVGNSENSGQRINIRHTDLTGYSELGFPIFSLVTGSVTSASPYLISGGFDDLTSGQDPAPAWGAFWGFWPPSASSAWARVDSTFYKDGGQSLKVYTVSYPKDSAVTQNVNLTPGDEYTISAWVYSNKDLDISQGTFVDIWLLSSSTTAGANPDYFVSATKITSLIGAAPIAANTWTKLSNKFVAPALPQQYYRIDLRTHAASGTTVWWDTVELVKEQSTSKISGLYFNDGEMFGDNIKIISDGTIIAGPIKKNTASVGLPDPTDIPDILKISGADSTYRLIVGHIDPSKAGFNLTKTGHMKVGVITSSATYANTTSVAYLGIDSNGKFARYSSSQSIKNNIISINNELGKSIDKNKILNSSPTIQYKKILDISPVEYDKIDEPGQRKLGLIADDVADKIPEIATYDKDNNPVYFDLSGLIAATIAVVQDQDKEIENLKQKILQLESKIGD